MILNKGCLFFITIFVINTKVRAKECYWNAECSYLHFGTKTPYETFRGDIRDYADPSDCEPISLWTIIRHGNRYPGKSVTKGMIEVLSLKDEIIDSFEKGKSQLCAQDVENLRKWQWNKDIESTPSQLTPVGYKELFDIGKRIREKYPVFFNGTKDDIYIRGTLKQRSAASARAFVDGLCDDTKLKLSPEEGLTDDNVAQSFENCDRFHYNLNNNKVFDNETEEFFKTEEVLKMIEAIQERLGIPTELTKDNIWILYELCRFERSWTDTYKSPWCSIFSEEDKNLLNYRDDVKRFYKNGYGVWFNPLLGAQPLKDLYEKFEAATQGKGKKINGYISHATMLEMIFTALDMYKDPLPLRGSVIQENRLWRSSIIDPMGNNFIAVLYSCQKSQTQTYKVQILHNEKLSGICPETGCSWEQFAEKFKHFRNVTLDFCELNSDENSE